MKRKINRRKDKEISFKSLKKLRAMLKELGLLHCEADKNKDLDRFNRKYCLLKNVMSDKDRN